LPEVSSDGIPNTESAGIGRDDLGDFEEVHFTSVIPSADDISWWDNLAANYGTVDQCGVEGESNIELFNFLFDCVATLQERLAGHMATFTALAYEKGPPEGAALLSMHEHGSEAHLAEWITNLVSIMDMASSVGVPSRGLLEARLREFSPYGSVRNDCLAVLLSRMAWADICILQANHWLTEIGIPMEPETAVTVSQALWLRVGESRARLAARSGPLHATRDPLAEDDGARTPPRILDESLARTSPPMRIAVAFGRLALGHTPFHVTPMVSKPARNTHPVVTAVSAMTYVQTSVLAQLNTLAMTSADNKQVAAAIEDLALHITNVPNGLWVSTFLTTRFQQLLDQMQRLQYPVLLHNWRTVPSAEVCNLLRLVFLDPLVASNLTNFSQVIDPKYFTIYIWRGMNSIQLQCALAEGFL
jgi:hypothetical protein